MIKVCKGGRTQEIKNCVKAELSLFFGFCLKFFLDLLDINGFNHRFEILKLQGLTSNR